MKKLLSLIVTCVFILCNNVAQGKNVAFDILGFSGSAKKANVEGSPKELKIIGAGFGRTGTHSLQAALQILGFKTYHMVEVGKHKGHDDLAIEAFKGSLDNMTAIKAWFDDMLLNGFTATVDFPTCKFYKEQMKLFPNAKVILTERDSDKWFNSFTKLLSVVPKLTGRPFKWFMMDRKRFSDGTVASPASPYGLGKSGCMTAFAANEGLYEPWYFPWVSYPTTAKLDKSKCLSDYEAHNAEVKRIVPKDKLLIMNIAEGWKPLCEFLQVPIPDAPFPSSNSNNELSQLDMVLWSVCTFYPFVGVAIFFAIFFIVTRCMMITETVLAKTKKAKFA